MLGELGFAKPRQAPVEVGDREVLPAQWRLGSTDHLKGMTQASLAKPPHDCVPFGKQGEVPDIMTTFAQPTDDLIEVSRLDDGHRCNDRSVVFGQGEVEDLVYALPPRGEILKITARSAGGRARWRPNPTCSGS